MFCVIVLVVIGIVTSFMFGAFGLRGFFENTPVAATNIISVYVGDELPSPCSWFDDSVISATDLAYVENTTNARIVDFYEPENLIGVTDTPGRHTVVLRLESGESSELYTMFLQVVDNVPPTATPVNISVPIGEVVESFGGNLDEDSERNEGLLVPSDFYTDLFDHSSTTSEFLQAPDLSVFGTQEVLVKITDFYGNYTIVEAVCEVFYIIPEVIIERVVVSETALTLSDFDVLDFVSFETLSNFEGEITLQAPETLPENFSRSVGEFEIWVLIDGVAYQSKISVIDTTPPEATSVLGRWIFLGERADSSTFFTTIPDEYESITSEFVNSPNWDYIGVQSITVRVSDGCGNYTIVESELSILHDITPPTILGARDFSVRVGTTVAFRYGVTVVDDLDPSPELFVNADAVNLNRAGTYPLVFTARDRSGNTSSVTVNVRVTEVSSNDLYNLADNRLHSLGVFNTNNMIERARLIHRYVRANMTYVRRIGPGEMSDIQFAYSTLRSMRGNCIATQRVSEILLRRAGIENMRIRNSDNTHSWNLIKINGNWYHYDATWYNNCHYEGSFMFTNETARRISPNRNNRYDSFDTTGLPEIQ